MAEKTISPRAYLGVYIALLALLVLTIVASNWHLGSLNLVVSLTIAVAKALLVVVIFMHLQFEHTVTRLFAAMGILCLALLIGLTMCDVVSRTWNMYS